MTNGKVDLRELALLGAQTELAMHKQSIATLERFIAHGGRARVEPVPKVKQRVMSAAARKRISDAQKARWAKQRQHSEAMKKSWRRRKAASA